MRVDSEDTLLGVPILMVRALLKRSMSYGGAISERLARRTLKLYRERTREILDELIRQGCLVQAENTCGELYWENTIKGNTLAMATAARLVKRETADWALAEFLTRVLEVNQNPDYLFKVTRVVLFGSYLEDTQRLDFVELAIETASKIDSPDQREALCLQRRQASQRNFKDFMEYLGWPLIEVWRFLKSRSRVIRLYDYRSEEKYLQTVKTRQIDPKIFSGLPGPEELHSRTARTPQSGCYFCFSMNSTPSNPAKWASCVQSVAWKARAVA